VGGVTLALVAIYAFVAGLWVAERRADKRARPAWSCHDSIRESARRALKTRALVGPGPSITNVSEWALGNDRFRITIEPLEKEQGTNEQS
jgi:hypothetical protein